MVRLLIVDDASFMRSSLKHMVSGTEFEVVGEATNGKEAVALYAELKPDLVTMDITMPVMNGIEAVKEIVANDASAKVVMISAMGQQKFVLESITSGASSFIVKPFDKDKVLEVLRNVQ